MQEIIGFHGTTKKSANIIIKDNFKINEPKNTDNHWLGHGVYFFEVHELATWWAQTKVNARNKKYNRKDSAAVLKCKILGNNILNLDNPFELMRFIEFCRNDEKRLIEEGVVIDFSKQIPKQKNMNKIITERKRCFFLDRMKDCNNISVIIYTFNKDNPSYASSKYHKTILNDFGFFHYNEKQICVTDKKFIVDITIIDQLYQEEII